MAELDKIIRRCNILGFSMSVVVLSQNIIAGATRGEICADVVAVLKKVLTKVEPHGSKLSLEFCGAAYNDAKRLWPDTKYDCCTLEIFRPVYYEMTQKDNIKMFAEAAKTYITKYC